MSQRRRPTPGGETPGGLAQPAAVEPSIAVLPFADASGGRDHRDLCEGLGAELINLLARDSDLRVASRTLSFRLRGEAADLRGVGRRLGVGAVLAGSLRRAGGRLRVDAELVDAADGSRLWSERFDRRLEDVFAILDEIATGVAGALEVILAPPHGGSGRRPTPGDIRAYEHCLRGRRLFFLRGRESLERARESFVQAVEIDSEYVLGYTGLADCCSFLKMHFGGSAACVEKALAASARALDLAPDLAEAHASRGLALSLEQRFHEADRCFGNATWLHPRLWEAYYFWARSCFVQGELGKALRLFERAAEVRPDDYQAPLLTVQLYRSLGRRREARSANRRGLQLARRRLELDPDDVRAWYMGAGALVDEGREEEGLEWARRALDLEPNDLTTLYNLACTLSVAGRLDDAVDCLERTVDLGFTDATQRRWMEHDSDLDALRHHPRYLALLERLT